jgi:glucan phosphorylase
LAEECNRSLTNLITEHIGDSWMTDLYQIKGIEKYIDDPQFLESFREIKGINKKNLSKFIYKETGIRTNPNSMFDIHVKRMHEYKRQLLNIPPVILSRARLSLPVKQLQAISWQNALSSSFIISAKSSIKTSK